MNLPTTTLIADHDFHNAWARGIRHVLHNGVPLTIGDETEIKPIRDACILFELTGNAIKQIENHELHYQFPFQHINPYCEEFTREYQAEYDKREEADKFTYTYFDRFVNYFNFDQLKYMDRDLCDQKAEGISSNRNQITTWHPHEDMGSSAAPCLQSIWVRYLGHHEVEVHWHFRSRDLYTAWQANVVALLDMINREVVRPNHCKVVKLVDYCDSAHIYESDLTAATYVNLVATNPMDRR